MKKSSLVYLLWFGMIPVVYWKFKTMGPRCTDDMSPEMGAAVMTAMGLIMAL